MHENAEEEVEEGEEEEEEEALPSCSRCASGLPALRPWHHRGELPPLLLAQLGQVDRSPFGHPYEAALPVRCQPLWQPRQRPFASFQARFVPHDRPLPSPPPPPQFLLYLRGPAPPPPPGFFLSGSAGETGAPRHPRIRDQCADPSPPTVRGSFMSRERREDGVPRCLGASQTMYSLFSSAVMSLHLRLHRFSLFFRVAHLCSCTPQLAQFSVMGGGGVSVLLPLTATEGGFRLVLQNKIPINGF